MRELSLTRVEKSTLDDAKIVNRILGGDKELFEILIRRYNQVLYRTIRSYLTHEPEVEDIMQNTYLKAFSKLHQFRGEAAFSTWLIRIGINEALLRIRSGKRQKIINLTDDTVPEKVLSLHENPETNVIYMETQYLIEKSIDQLPEKYRIVYVLKEIEGMDTDEIAGCLNLSASNVKVRLHRARKLLKETIYKYTVEKTVFEFGNKRCDRIVEYVMIHI